MGAMLYSARCQAGPSFASRSKCKQPRRSRCFCFQDKMAVLTERHTDGSSYFSVTSAGMTLQSFLSTDRSGNHGGFSYPRWSTANHDGKLPEPRSPTPSPELLNLNCKLTRLSERPQAGDHVPLSALRVSQVEPLLH